MMTYYYLAWFIIMYQFLTVKQVSEALQIHWQTALTYIKTGRLKAIRVGRGYRVSEESLREFLEKAKV